MDFNADHFTLFEQPRTFRQDASRLDKRYREIQAQVHPDKFTQAGAGDAAQSWVGGGANQPVSPDVVTQALGPNVIGDIAARLGVGHGDAAGGIAQVLPELIDKLTPHGQAPQGGLGSEADIMGALTRMLQR